MAKINSAKVRVAVVGAGAMANRVHYPSLAQIPNVEIAGICDVNSETLAATADKYNIVNRYSDYRRMVEELRPDAIYVLGQPHQLYDAWVWCLEQKLNLFIEKPMGVNLHQSMNLAYLADKNESITQVGFQRRNSAMVKSLLAKCREKGPVIHAVCTFTKQFEGPMMRAYDEMYDITIHAIDTLRAICGGEIVSIDSSARRIRIPNFNAIFALIHFDNGATGVLMNNHISGRRTFSFEIHCPDICAIGELEGQGRLYRSAASNDAYFKVADGEEVDAMSLAGSCDYHVYGGYQAKHEEFIDCLRTGQKPSSHFGDALKTMQAAEVILAQALMRGVDEFEKVYPV